MHLRHNAPLWWETRPHTWNKFHHHCIFTSRLKWGVKTAIILFISNTSWAKKVLTQDVRDALHTAGEEMKYTPIYTKAPSPNITNTRGKKATMTLFTWIWSLLPAVILEMVQHASFLMLFLWFWVSRFNKQGRALQPIITCKTKNIVQQSWAAQTVNKMFMSRMPTPRNHAQTQQRWNYLLHWSSCHVASQGSYKIPIPDADRVFITSPVQAATGSLNEPLFKS